MSLMIVESPAKAKTITKYFDKKMVVMPSFGHVRELPTRKSAIDVKDNFTMHYRVIKESLKTVELLAKEAKKHSHIYLATDPDREGEAIAWHIIEVLKERNAIKDSAVVKRITFNEITKEATNHAVKNGREIDINFVHSQQARTALDHLFGLSVSPLLWVTIPGSKSAGRVQSVALRLICDREVEIVNFVPEEYWDISSTFYSNDKVNVKFSLVKHEGVKLEKFSIQNEEKASLIAESLKHKIYEVSGVKEKRVLRKPQTPFTTSTLQQESSVKLGFSPKKTMMIAQKLYEGIEVKNKELSGLITYMRTDGCYISDSAIQKIRKMIQSLYGKDFVPSEPRVYKSKIKNSQEAHEAIRPTDAGMTPESLKNKLTNDEWRLYELIWKRTVASQTADAEFSQLTITIDSCSEDSITSFSSTASKLVFEGFYLVYGGYKPSGNVPQISNDAFEINTRCEILKTEKFQHFTQHLPRYTEATLIKKMEEIGIGRPSTYATIVSVIQNRKYAELNSSKNLVPSTRGQVVTVFLSTYLHKYVEYDFTTQMEERLDFIANGNVEWKCFIKDFWNPLEVKINSIKELEKKTVLLSVDKKFFELLPSDTDRKCNICDDGQLIISASAKGIFLGCSNYPNCKNIKSLSNTAEAIEDSRYPMLLCKNSNEESILLKKGPYGYYLHVEESNKKISLPKNFNQEILEENENLVKMLASMPTKICRHPETGSEIFLGISKYGLYIRMDDAFYSTKKNIAEADKITLEEILLIISKNKKASPNKLLGKTTKGTSVYLCSGKYGKYIKSGKTNVSIKNIDEDTVDLSFALDLLKTKNKSKE